MFFVHRMRFSLRNPTFPISKILKIFKQRGDPMFWIPIGGYREILRILDIGNGGFLNENRILCTKNVKIFRLRRYFERLFLFWHQKHYTFFRLRRKNIKNVGFWARRRRKFLGVFCAAGEKNLGFTPPPCYSTFCNKGGVKPSDLRWLP